MEKTCVRCGRQSKADIAGPCVPPYSGEGVHVTWTTCRWEPRTVYEIPRWTRLTAPACEPAVGMEH